MEELDQYLTGRMDSEERSRFEERLNHDPTLQAALKVQEGLSQLRLQRKVGEVAKARKEWERRRKRRWFFMVIAIAGLACLAFFFLSKNKASDSAPAELPTELPADEAVPNAPPTQPQKNEEAAPIQPLKDKALNKPTPIADANLDDNPPYPAPNVRGQGSEKKPLKITLDKIWYTNYPFIGKTLDAPLSEAGKLLEEREFNKAYVQLQQLERKNLASDTLRFLKGYCLMEMGEGAEALAYFEQLEQTHPEWADQLQWFRGLSHILNQDKKKAMATFKEIAAQPSHPYRLQSVKAVSLLKMQ